jgi:hypothetical protein
VLSGSSSLVEIGNIAGVISDGVLEVEDLLNVFVTRPGVFNLGGGLGTQINLVQFDRLEVLNVRSGITVYRRKDKLNKNS